MKTIGDQFKIGGLTVRNRIGAAPMGNASQTTDDGAICQATIDHYRAVAQSGTAWITLGHVAVSEKYPAKVFRPGAASQSAIWSDRFIEGMQRLTAAVHAEGAAIVVQVEHAGMRSAVPHPPAPSQQPVPFSDGDALCHALTVQEIREEEQSYWDAGRRAVLAGFDGIELSASNGWMLHNWSNPRINLREDAYGQDKLLLFREIYAGIRESAPDDFIIGVRLAGFNPDLETGIQQGKAVEAMGIDYISLCNNPLITWMPQVHDLPSGYPYSPQIYSAAMLKKAVKVPVLCANGIFTTADAENVLRDTDIDMVLIGRGMLADPDWTRKAFSGLKQIRCRECSPHCMWKYGEQCAAVKSGRLEK